MHRRLARFGRYRGAIVRDIPPTFAEKALRSSTATPIDLKKAQEQHERYVRTLGLLNLERLTRLPTLASHPDSCFVEDTAIVTEGQSVITRPGHPSRRGEVDDVKRTLQTDFKFKCNDMNDDKQHEADDESRLDGGDVLYTGDSIFVGVSSRTNHAGIEWLRECLRSENLPVHKVDLEGKSALHLKSLMTMANSNTLVCSPDGEDIARFIADIVKSTRSDNKVEGWDRFSIRKATSPGEANCVFANDHILCRSSAEFPSIELLYEDLAKNVVHLNMSELEKADGALSCCSLLIP
eukprot:gb/GECG01001123.1/.p1 GENE.gb/GECG01001123.1/~~gb/GECG01001123.1/.p1  ORF type:complete len:294 (+),score=33.68 gb/GECG01001123.1/:1-882(+)